QYDLNAVNIPLSCDTIDETTWQPPDAGAVRLAPDGKIYYTQCYIPIGTGINYPYQDSLRSFVNENLGVVNNPDVIGSSCNFTPFSFYLGGKRTYWGLPNNPDYSLVALVGSACDTLSVNVNEIAEKSAAIYISPNPATRIIYFNTQHLKGKHGMLTIVSMNGEQLYQKPIAVFNGGYATQRIDVSSLPDGMYFINLQTDKERVSGKLLVNR
ncbi:MAG: T9SS type A sorting domain-containing protein, partial [Bacteroidota bacterium]